MVEKKPAPRKSPRKKAAPKADPVVVDKPDLEDVPYDPLGDLVRALRESGWGPDAEIRDGVIHTAMGETNPLLSVEACAAIGVHVDEPVELAPLPREPGLPQATA